MEHRRSAGLQAPMMLGVLAVTLVVAGFATIFGVWWIAGQQQFVTLQLPLLLVGGCLGFGLLVFGTALGVAHQRLRHRAEVEEAAARVLVAAAHAMEASHPRNLTP